ncbi:MAG: hypothetical protein IPI00_12765 [Flavobacteriales bacterium]|nr:hypothetical protein [Flavobacteriales bacterium]
MRPAKEVKLNALTARGSILATWSSADRIVRGRGIAALGTAFVVSIAPMAPA